MAKEEFEPRLEEFEKTLKSALDRYEKQNPDWWTVPVWQILHYGLKKLRGMLKKHRISWENPVIELGYPVEADWDQEEPVYFNLSPDDLEDEGKVEERYKTSLIIVRNQYVLGSLTNNVLVVTDNKNRLDIKLPYDLVEELNNLAEQERAQELDKIIPEKLIYNFTLPPITIDDPPGKVEIIYSIGACTLEVGSKTACYPILIGLDFKPRNLSTELKAAYLNALIKTVLRNIPKENLDFLQEIITKPPAQKSQALIKAGLHLEQQKFGHRPPVKQPGLFESLLDTTQKDVIKEGIEVIGLDITESQARALEAIQKLFTETDYRGNLKGRNIDAKEWWFTGYLPALEFTTVQYLEAYGLKKVKTDRGKEEYNGLERADALKALIDLAKNNFLFTYKRHYWKEVKGKKEEQVERIETIAPLIKIIRGWEGLTKYEDKMLDQGQSTQATDEKLKAIAIEPAPIMVQDIHSYFILKPADWRQEIAFKYPWPDKPSKFTFRFIEWLMLQAEQKRRKRQPLIIEENIEEIAYHLRLDSYIKTRQTKRIRQIVNKAYRIAKELGYLKSYETIQGKTKELERLELNPEKFEWAKSVEKESDESDLVDG